MDEKTQKKVEKFLEGAKSVEIYGYALGVFIVALNHNANDFHAEFTRWNEKNGINFQIVKLPNNKYALSEW